MRTSIRTRFVLGITCAALAASTFGCAAKKEPDYSQAAARVEAAANRTEAAANKAEAAAKAAADAAARAQAAAAKAEARFSHSMYKK